MIVVDTSVWIEFFRGNPPIFLKLKELVETRQVTTCECVFGELLQGAKTKRERTFLREYWKNLPKIDESNIWIEAGAISSERKLNSKGVGLIDCVIILSARRLAARVWTLDKKLQKVLKKEELYL